MLNFEFSKLDIKNIKINPFSKYLDIISAYKIKKLIGTQLDIIHIHQSGDLSTAVLLKKLFHFSKIVYSQQMDSRFNKKDLFHKWIYKNVDQIVTMTNDMKNNHIANTPVNKKNITTIYNGIDLSRFSKKYTYDKDLFLTSLNIPLNRIVLGCVARLDSLKNQALLIDSVALLIKEKNLNLHLLIIGDETDSITGKGYKQKLIEKVNNLSLSKNVTFIEFTNEIDKYFDIMDIFVLPTDKESFGYVLIEAMAKGKPVIASNQCGPLEIIENGKNGFHFESRNKLDLAEKIEKLSESEEIRQTMGKNSHEIALKKFDFKVTIDLYVNLFERLIEQKVNK